MIQSVGRQVAVVGTGYSDVAKHSHKPAGVLAIEACHRAVHDAGMSIADIDGLSNYPNPSRPGAGVVDGVDFVGVNYLARALKLHQLRWYCSVTQGTTAAALVEAANAISAGVCDRVLVWRAMHNPPGAFGRVELRAATGDAQFTAPYGLSHAVLEFALAYSEYMHRYGATRDDMAAFVVRNRSSAAINPDAAFYGEPIDETAYRNARMIGEPLSLLDCDMPVDGCGAVVLSAVEEKRHSSTHPPAFVVGTASTGLRYRHSLTMSLDDFMDGARHLASVLWEGSGIGSSSVRHINVYDGFSYFVYLFLEAFGFCGPGEGFGLAGDRATAPNGALPLNTSGGALGMGRLHGMPQIIEAVRQVQGRSVTRWGHQAELALAQVGSPLQGAGAILFAAEPRRPHL